MSLLNTLNPATPPEPKGARAVSLTDRPPANEFERARQRVEEKQARAQAFEGKCPKCGGRMTIGSKQCAKCYAAEPTKPRAAERPERVAPPARQRPIDYRAVLDDLKAWRTQIDGAISAIERLMESR